MQALLIDSSIYIFKSYFSLPEKWHAQENQYSTQAVYGFTNFLLDLLKKQQPDYIFCAFDESLQTGFRHQLCPNYKINRELPDQALAFQLNACRQLCRVLGITEMASHKYEADDLLGAMAKQVRGAGMQPVIMTRDKDLTQIIQQGDLYWDIGKSQPKDYKQLEQDLGVGCHQMADYLALVGDTSDSIAGVPGVGPKTARELLAWMPSVDHIIENRDQLSDLPIRGAAKLSDKIADNQDQLLLSRKLATIVTDIEEVPSCDKLQWQGVYQDAFTLFADEMGFGEVFNSRSSQLRQRQFQPVMGS
ncbi:MAG: 5'-3' exonuclease H3TH domain-containing protein [Porticoccaceae bacterium]